MKYKVVEIKGTFPGNYGDTRVNLTLENEQGIQKDVSGFFKVVPEKGNVLEGEVVQNGNYWNFKFPKRSPGAFSEADKLTINRKLDTIITKLDQLLGTKKSFYPDVSAKTEMSDFGEDDIDPAQIPF